MDVVRADFNVFTAPLPAPVRDVDPREPRESPAPVTEDPPHEASRRTARIADLNLTRRYPRV
jgi:hypothetical protein